MWDTLKRTQGTQQKEAMFYLEVSSHFNEPQHKLATLVATLSSTPGQAGEQRSRIGLAVSAETAQSVNAPVSPQEEGRVPVTGELMLSLSSPPDPYGAARPDLNSRLTKTAPSSQSCRCCYRGCQFLPGELCHLTD